MIQKVSKFLISATIGAAAVAAPASAESIIVCGDPAVVGQGAEITVAQWLPGPDALAPVVKRAHWRIVHRLVSGPFCPAFEVEMSQAEIYIRVRSPAGGVVTSDEFSMYHLTDSRPNFTGEYSLFLDTEPSPENGVYTWYKEPMLRQENGRVIKSPTIGMSQDGRWETGFPLVNGFEGRTVTPDTTSIIVD